MLDLVPITAPTAEGVILWFVESTLVASVLALVALLGARVRSFGPAVRHALWLVVLFKLMTPPLVHWPWSWPWPGSMNTYSITQEPGTSDECAIRIGEERDLPRNAAPRNDGDLIATVDDVGDDAHPEAVSAASSPISVAPQVPSASLRRVDRRKGAFLGMLHPAWRGTRPWVVSIWLAGSMAVAVAQARRILRFRRRLYHATPAPRWLTAEAERIGRRLCVRIPAIRVVDGLRTPLLWCLGRPVLLVPGDLFESLEADRWRGILAHELAHLRRGDPWVRRLELVAGLVWWWNPLYWLAVHRLDFEAELACDAWVLWALPNDRLGYAESLVRICASLSLARSPAPALGVAGTGRSFERRLMMILRDRVSHRASMRGIIAAMVLALLALPSWTHAHPARVEVGKASTTATAPDPGFAPVVDEAGTAAIDDRDDDDDDPKPAKKSKTAKAKKPTTKSKKAADDDDDDREARLKEALGPDFEKKMEALGEKIGKEMERKFGPEFEKKMEAFGKEIEAKFGPEFQKKMEAIGKEIEAKFGPEFEKKMEAFGKEMAEKLGPGSNFEKEMKSFGEKMAKDFGPGSEFAEKMKDLEEVKAKAKATAKLKAKEVQTTNKPRASAKKAKVTTSKRAERIEALESRIEELMKELERLKAQDNEEEDNEGGDS